MEIMVISMIHVYYRLIDWDQCLSQEVILAATKRGHDLFSLVSSNANLNALIKDLDEEDDRQLDDTVLETSLIDSCRRGREHGPESEARQPSSSKKRYTTYRFGLKLKRVKRKPSSDFCFDFELKVVASHPASTGFLVKVYKERQDSEPWLVFFVSLCLLSNEQWPCSPSGSGC